MNITIIDTPFTVDLYGFSGIAINKNWKETGFGLMDRMWKVVKSGNLANKGINFWVYEENYGMFAGVELEKIPQNETGLELKKVNLPKYIYYKHIGPYSQLGQVGSKVLDEIKKSGIKTCLPYLEIYGHWTQDESKLETELLWCVG